MTVGMRLLIAGLLYVAICIASSKSYPGRTETPLLFFPNSAKIITHSR